MSVTPAVSVGTLEAVDPLTVRITLRENVPNLLGIVTNYSGGYIVSRRAATERGDGFARAPIGTGPFALERVTPNASAEFVAHPQYFRGAPRIQRISYRFIPSDASRDLAFQNRELDINYGRADQTWLTRTRALPGVTVEVFEPGELTILNLDITRPPFNDLRIRQAVAHAINRPEMVRFRGADVSREAQSLVPRGYLGFTADNGLLGFGSGLRSYCIVSRKQPGISVSHNNGASQCLKQGKGFFWLRAALDCIAQTYNLIYAF